MYKRVLANECFGLDQPGVDEMLKMVPKHSSHLCACVQCKRVTNAVADDGGSKWSASFTEIGTSGSMMSTDPDTSETDLKCAKRSSASFKTARVFEEHMTERAVESAECSKQSVVSMISDSTTASGHGTPARVRRDSKTAMEQKCTSIACGKECLLTIPLVGRAVRLWSGWYALCSFCGCCVRFSPSNKYHAQICCLRCDFKLLNRTLETKNTGDGAVGLAAPSCRYCGKVDGMRSGTRWRSVKAPLDVSGRNATLPPPLRTVHFCPKHFRTWVPNCMKTMETRVILSHIVYGARPCYDPAAASTQMNEEDVPALRKRKRCTKRCKKK